MKASSFLQPVSAPHKTRVFWMIVALGLVPVLATPFFMRLRGFPPFPLHVQISSGAITFLLWAIASWFILRFGRVALVAVALAMLSFALWAGFHA